jgi:hypothetical protein
MNFTVVWIFFLKMIVTVGGKMPAEEWGTEEKQEMKDFGRRVPTWGTEGKEKWKWKEALWIEVGIWALMYEQCHMSVRMVHATCQMMVGMDAAMKCWQKCNTVRRGVMQCMHDEITLWWWDCAVRAREEKMRRPLVRTADWGRPMRGEVRRPLDRTADWGSPMRGEVYPLVRTADWGRPKMGGPGPNRRLRQSGGIRMHALQIKGRQECIDFWAMEGLCLQMRKSRRP